RHTSSKRDWSSDVCSSDLVDLVRQSDWSTEPPPWLGRESLHMTHRSNLVWKDPAFYGQRFPDDLPEHPTVEAEYWEYEWPASEWDLVSRMTENWNVALSRFQGCLPASAESHSAPFRRFLVSL